MLGQLNIAMEKKGNLNPNLRPHNKTIPDEFRSSVKGKIKLLEENIRISYDLEEEKNLHKKLEVPTIKGKKLINYTILKF